MHDIFIYLYIGGSAQTLTGLAGIGDLVLTCTGTLSRNYQVGFALAQGKTMDQIKAESKAVAEGTYIPKDNLNIHKNKI